MLLDLLKWRYATKKMDPAKAVPEDKVERILEAARLAPTSSGLQPFEIIVPSKTRRFGSRSSPSPGIRPRSWIAPICWSSPPGTTTRPSAST